MGGTGLTYEGDGFVAKYSSTGAFQWAKDLGGSTVYDITLALGTDALGDVYVGGVFDDIMVVSPTITLNSGTDGSAYLIKYDPAGNVIWAHNYGDPGTTASDCFPRSLQVSNGFIYVAGFFQATSGFDPWEATPTTLTSVGLYDFYVAKYDTAGNFVFVRQVIGTGGTDDEFGSLALDASDNIYVTGWTNSSSITFDPSSPGTTTFATPGGGGNDDMVMAKFSSSGVYQWGTIVGSTGNELGRCIDISGSNIVCTGYFSNTVDFDPSGAVANLTSAGGSDIFVTKYDLNGNYLCGFRDGSATANDEGLGITHDAAGGYSDTTGQFGGSAVDFDPGTTVDALTSIGGLDAYLVEYNYVGAATFTGSLAGSTICSGDSAQLTLTVTSGGAGPYTVTYSDGTTSHTIAGVASGVPFTVTPNPATTTTYSVVSITNAATGICTISSGTGFGSATITVTNCTNSCDSINFLSDTLHLCRRDTATLHPILTGNNSILSILWSPATGLSTTTALNPVLTAVTSGWYDITVQTIIPNNLVVNGNFNAGSTGFTTGDVLEPPGSTSPGHYAVTTDLSLYNSAFPATGDHTTGTGNMLFIDASTTAGVTFWCESIPVLANTGYVFSVWVELAYPPPPSIEVIINGTVVGTYAPAATAGIWTNYQVIWNSGAATTANICMEDLSLVSTGNDFAVDDISFEQICVVKDSIYATVTPIDTTYSHVVDSACAPITSVTLTAPSGYSSYSWSTGVTTITTTVGAAGAYWVYAPGSCALLIDTFHVDIAHVDTTSGHVNDSVCAPITSVTLTAPTGYASYLWSTGSTATSINVTAVGAYWVYAPGACTMFVDTFHVALAHVDTTYGHVNDSVCAPVTSVTLTAPAGHTSYLWSTGSTATSINVTTVGNYWVYAAGSCTMLVDTFHVALAHVDTTYSHADSTTCASTLSITLVAPSGYSSYLWSTGITSSSVSVTTAGAYWVYAAGECTMLIDTFHVLFNPLPVVNLGNDTSFCAGNTLVLTSVQPAGNTYQWSTGSTADTIHVSTTGTYWLHIHNGCDATDTIHITVNAPPVVNLGPDTMNCQGNPLLLQSSITYPAGTTYLWNTGATIASITAATTGTYWLQVSSSVGGCPGSDTVNISILYDTVKLHTTDTAICKGQSVQVITTGNPINTYQWVPTTGIANSTVGSPVIFGDTSAMYVMTAYFPGCPDIIDSFYLDVQPDPINVYIGGNRAVCEYDTLHLHASVTPAWYTHYMYSWTPTTFLDYPTMPNVVFTAGDSTTIVLTVTTSAGCTGEDSAKIAVHPGDFAHVDSLYNVCPRDSVQFKPTGGVSYQWIPSMYIDSPGLSIAPWVHPITSQHYTMIAMSQYGCMDTLSLYVSVQPAAAIYLGDSVTIYPGESYQITPQTNCTSFSWSPSSGLNDAYIANPTAMPDVNTIYVVTASTESGCVTKDSIAIYVSPETLLALPNAFTPGNGPNNLFKIIKRGVATLNYFRVFNRWGNMVYESSNIDDGWDGSYKGKPQPYDVYIYEVEAKTELGRTFHMHGNVTLIR